MYYTHQINVRTNDELFNRLNEQKRLGLTSKSKIMRTATYAYLDTHLGERMLKQMLAKRAPQLRDKVNLYTKCADAITAMNKQTEAINRVGNNLNQLTRAINAGLLPPQMASVIKDELGLVLNHLKGSKATGANFTDAVDKIEKRCD